MRLSHAAPAFARALGLQVLQSRFHEMSSRYYSRGRDRHCWRPPAQIPASGITALGSCHGYLAANRAWGQGCLILVVGR